MAVPAAPVEGGGDKVLFLQYDAGGGVNAAAIIAAGAPRTVNGEVIADVSVYPTSGGAATGYIATSSGSEMPLTGGGPSVLCQGVLVKADPDNTEDIWVGISGLTTDKSSTDGYRLSPGESVGMPTRDAALIHIRRGGSVDQGAYWIASADIGW
jgi:hypothetical protein